MQLIEPELVTLTVEQYHRMLETGILTEGEPVELIGGLLTKKKRGPQMTVNPLHAFIVNRLMRLMPALEGFGYHLRLQNPITIPPHHEPEPDGAIVTGALEDYAEHHPSPADTLCVIEVADSSLDYDRTVKQEVYAGAGIPYYLIINLPESRVECYQQPDIATARYNRQSSHPSQGNLVLTLPDRRQLVIDSSDCLP